MKKLKLDIDALAVQSFAAGAAPEARGTVRGRATAWNTCAGRETCAFPDTCADTCGANSCYTCVNSCVLEYCTLPGC